MTLAFAIIAAPSAACWEFTPQIFRVGSFYYSGLHCTVASESRPHLGSVAPAKPYPVPLFRFAFGIANPL